MTFGQKSSDDRKIIAKQAIVFLLNGIDVHFEYPIAYYFIHELDQHQRKELLTEAISMVTRCGIKLISITCDGHPANIPALTMLGANLKINLATTNEEFRPYIDNPISQEPIYVILDPCHMEKCIRNRWATCKVFYDSNGNRIEWRYIEALYEYSWKNDFRPHKLTEKHIQWKRNSMNVSLAVQTFSEAVASSIEFLQSQNVPEFQGAAATIDFIRRMNTLFDVFNSRHSSHHNIFKQRMSIQNKRVIYDLFNDSIQFFKLLKTDVHYYEARKKQEKGDEKKKEKLIVRTEIMPILNTIHKVGFLAFIADMQSLMKIFETYVEEGLINTSIATYNLLQDPLEMSLAEFVCVRRI